MNREHQRIILEEFVPFNLPPRESGEFSWWFIFRDNRLLVEENNGSITIPRFKSPEQKNIQLVRHHYLGQLGKINCYSGELDPKTSIPTGYTSLGLRQLFGLIGDDLMGVAGRAVHILYWDSTTQYCGRCGQKIFPKTEEKAKECPGCGLIIYPQLAPAVIILIERGNELLLARSPHFQKGLYSVIAGFVEPGETLEQTVTREIREEVGIEVQNIRYFGSQHWPFPHSLMIAFTAEYLKGQIIVDQREIEDACWFTIDHLPLIPSKMSISRQLIDWFIEKQSRINPINEVEQGYPVIPWNSAR